MSAAALEQPVPLRGRHRNSALAAYRRARAIEMRISGMTYERIAAELGYSNRGTVSRIVSTALQAREADDVDLLRATELARLDDLLASVWEGAMAGDVDSNPSGPPLGSSFCGSACSACWSASPP